MASPAARAWAQDPVFMEAGEHAGYWSAGRLMRAEPLDMPAAASLRVEELPEIHLEDALANAGGQVAGYGASPVGDEQIAPDLDARIHPPLPRSQAGLRGADELEFEDGASGALTPADVGSIGAWFSSSRLVPTDARLHYPYSTVGKLFFTKPGEGNFVCSGAVLRPRVVLTAGHCVHRGSGGNRGFYGNFLFVPAFHQGQSPFQAWNVSFVVTTGSWATSNGSVPNRADFAILVISDRRIGGRPTRIGNATGWLGYRTNALLPNHAKMIGYPVNFDGGQITHQVDAQHFRAAGAETVVYGSDMGGGSSGGLWIENSGRPRAARRAASGSSSTAWSASPRTARPTRTVRGSWPAPC